MLRIAQAHNGAVTPGIRPLCPVSAGCTDVVGNAVICCTLRCSSSPPPTAPIYHSRIAFPLAAFATHRLFVINFAAEPRCVRIWYLRRFDLHWLPALAHPREVIPHECYRRPVRQIYRDKLLAQVIPRLEIPRRCGHEVDCIPAAPVRGRVPWRRMPH